MAKREPALIDLRLVRAHEHPIRIEILQILTKGPNSPARICRRLKGVSLNLVSHHMKVLQEAGCIKLLETVEKGGTTEHVYEALEPRFIRAAEWEELTPKLRQPTTATILRLISADVSRALQQGTFDEGPSRHLSRSPLNLDREGWEEVVDILRRTLDEVLEVRAKSAERVASSGERTTPARVAILQFTLPPEDDEDGEAPAA